MPGAYDKFLNCLKILANENSYEPETSTSAIDALMLSESIEVRAEIEKRSEWPEMCFQFRRNLQLAFDEEGMIDFDKLARENVTLFLDYLTNDIWIKEEFQDQPFKLSEAQIGLLKQDPIIAKRLWLLENMSVDLKGAVITFKNKKYTVNAETALFFFRLRESWPRPVSCNKEKLRTPSEIDKTLRYRELRKLVGKNSGGATLNLDNVM